MKTVSGWRETFGCRRAATLALKGMLLRTVLGNLFRLLFFGFGYFYQAAATKRRLCSHTQGCEVLILLHWPFFATAPRLKPWLKPEGSFFFSPGESSETRVFLTGVREMDFVFFFFNHMGSFPKFCLDPGSLELVQQVPQSRLGQNRTRACCYGGYGASCLWTVAYIVGHQRRSSFGQRPPDICAMARHTDLPPLLFGLGTATRFARFMAYSVSGCQFGKCVSLV